MIERKWSLITADDGGIRRYACSEIDTKIKGVEPKFRFTLLMDEPAGTVEVENVYEKISSK